MLQIVISFLGRVITLDKELGFSAKKLGLYCNLDGNRRVRVLCKKNWVFIAILMAIIGGVLLERRRLSGIMAEGIFAPILMTVVEMSARYCVRRRFTDLRQLVVSHLLRQEDFGEKTLAHGFLPFPTRFSLGHGIIVAKIHEPVKNNSGVAIKTWNDVAVKTNSMIGRGGRGDFVDWRKFWQLKSARVISTFLVICMLSLVHVIGPYER